MSGYIGGILILSGCFMYGLSYSQRLKIRITILKDMVRMLSYRIFTYRYDTDI